MSDGPSTALGSGGGAQTPTSRGAAASRLTHIEWYETTLKAPVEITGTEKAPTPEEQLRKQLGMREGDTRPILLYFHYAHAGTGDDPEAKDVVETRAGKESRKQCSKFDDEAVARWSRLYRVVEVDASSSDAAVLRQFGAEDGKPSFSVLDNDLKVVTTSPVIASSRKFVAFLETTLKKRFADDWKAVQEAVLKQEKAIDEAAELADDEDYAAATKKLFEIVVSDIRIGAHWDDAVQRYWVVKRKAEGG